ncbi:MAG: response regulator [Gemmatimonadales bacterium]
MTGEVARRKILFVEDEADLRKAYRIYFTDRYEMAFAGSGAEALEQLGAFMPDVLVLDMRLPDTDGVDLLGRVRNDYPNLPVVITTAYSSLEPVVGVLGMDHSGYLLKPFDLKELEAAIDAAR